MGGVAGPNVSSSFSGRVGQLRFIWWSMSVMWSGFALFFSWRVVASEFRLLTWGALAFLWLITALSVRMARRDLIFSENLITIRNLRRTYRCPIVSAKYFNVGIPRFGGLGTPPHLVLADGSVVWVEALVPIYTTHPETIENAVASANLELARRKKRDRTSRDWEPK